MFWRRVLLPIAWCLLRCVVNWFVDRRSRSISLEGRDAMDEYMKAQAALNDAVAEANAAQEAANLAQAKADAAANAVQPLATALIAATQAAFGLK